LDVRRASPAESRPEPLLPPCVGVGGELDPVGRVALLEPLGKELEHDRAGRLHLGGRDRDRDSAKVHASSMGHAARATQAWSGCAGGSGPSRAGAATGGWGSTSLRPPPSPSSTASPDAIVRCGIAASKTPPHGGCSGKRPTVRETRSTCTGIRRWTAG